MKMNNITWSKIAPWKQTAIEILFIIVLSLVPLLWFHDKQVVVGLDSGYGVNYILYYIQRFYTWLGSQNLGVDMSVEVAVMPLSGLPALINFLGVPAHFVQKILFSGWFFLILGSMYLFTKYIFSEDRFWAIRIIAPVIYAFNLHIYSFWLQGEQPILSSYVLTPLVSMYIHKFVTMNISPLKAAVLLNLIYLLFGSGGVRGFPLIGPAILVTISLLIFYYVLQKAQDRKKYLKRLLLLGIFSIVILLITNAYYLLPFILSRNSQFSAQVNMVGGLEGTIAWLKMVSTHANLLNIFRLHGDNNWYDKPYLWAFQYLKNPFLIIGSFLFPILAYASVLLAIKKKEFSFILYLTILSIIGLFFTAGSNSPFGFLYTGMMKFLPGFAAFRSAYYKFIPTVTFSYALLIGFSVYQLVKRIDRRFRTILYITCILGLLIYHFPFFDNRNFEFNKPFRSMLSIPSYVEDFASWRNAATDDFRTLVVPHSNKNFPLKTYTWGYWGSYPIFPLISDKTFVQFDPFLFNASENVLVDTLYALLRKKDFRAFMHAARLTHIRYILLTKDIASDYSLAPTEAPLSYEELLSDSLFFRKIWNKGEWALYEIADSSSFSKIHSSSQLSMFTSEMDTVSNMFELNHGEFILKNQLSDTNSAFLDYIGSSIRSINCISCAIRAVPEDPVIPSSSVYPGSLLYTYKLWRDNEAVNKLNSESNKLGTFLGLSAKRTGEIMRLINEPSPVSSKEVWIKSIDELESNWLAIEKEASIALDTIDYNTLYLIYRYGNKQRDVINKTYTALYIAREGELIPAIEETLGVIERVTENVENAIREYNWDSNFVYELKQGDALTASEERIFIHRWSLPKDSSGNIILPQFQIDDTTTKSAVIDDDTVSLGVIPQNAERVRIFFDGLTDVLTEKSEQKINLAGSNKNCLVGKVMNFSWDETYTIRSVSLTDTAPKFIYLKRIHGSFPTQDFPSVQTSYFQPDLTLSPSNEAGREHVYEYKGQQNDTGITVYFCTDEYFSPTDVFGSISVFENYIPSVYAVSPYVQKNDISPEISYERINPTNYKISVKNASGPFILSFLEGFSPNWILMVDGQEVKDHEILNGYANGWIVGKTGDFTMELYFYTQRLMIVGLIITAISVLLCVSYLLIIRVQNKQ